jgi:hypothetical protein
MLLPAIYAFSREIHETRYLYILFPAFSLLSLYGIRFIENKIQKRLLFTVIIVGIIVSSMIYLENKGLDVNEAKEQYQFAKLIAEKSNGINEYSGIEYIKITHLFNSDFPTLSKDIIKKPVIIYEKNMGSLEEFIEDGRKKQLTHIIVEKESSNQPEFIKKLFSSYEKNPYLSVELDSKELGFKKDVKLLRINYELFDLNQKVFQ